MALFWQIIGAIIVFFTTFSTMGVIWTLFDSRQRMSETRIKEVYTPLKRFSIMMLISLVLSVIFLSCNTPVIGEHERMEFILSEYKEAGQFYDCWLVYDEKINQYKYCCFDDQANLIGLTAQLDSEIIRIPKTEYLAEPYHVEILSFEVRTKLTNRVITHITHQIIFIPDEEYAIIDKNNLAQFRH